MLETMGGAKHTFREEAAGVATFVAVIWAVFLVDAVLPVDLGALGLRPRTLGGLVGIAASPFLHASLPHILGNTVPLLVLLALLSGSRARTWGVVAGVALLGGALLWVVGRSANHIGASGLVFGLAAFLIVAGFLERRAIPLLVAVLVAFLYGGTLLTGVLPTVGPGVSWDGHLCGAAAGAIVAYTLARPRKPDAPATNLP